MKKSELKNLIKECVKEVLFESGVLASIVTEVMVGVNDANMLSETKINEEQNHRHQQEREEAYREKINETRRKMTLAAGERTFKGVFEGIEPISKPASPETSSAQSPLANTDPGNPGVNINGIMNIAGNAWKRLK